MIVIEIKSKAHGNQNVFIDGEDFELFKNHKWHIGNPSGNSLYAQRTKNKNGKKSLIRLHREITDCPKGKQVDHINRNTLDNRRENLRICSGAENALNKSKIKNNTSVYKGVYLMKRDNVFVSQISYKNKMIYLGRFKTQEEAAICYNENAVKLHGKFASLNEVI